MERMRDEPRVTPHVAYASLSLTHRLAQRVGPGPGGNGTGPERRR